MARVLLSLLAVFLHVAHSHPAGLDCGTDATTRLRAGQTIMKSIVAEAPADAPVMVDVKGSEVTVTSQVGIFFAARAFGDDSTLTLTRGDATLDMTKDCTNQVYTVSGKSTTYTFKQTKATSVVVGYASAPGVVSLVTAKVPAVAAMRGMRCPKSPAWVHASAQITTTAAASCDKVKEEMLARIAGQATHIWHDPHNNGTYHLDDASTSSISIHRVSGNHKPGPYTDKLIFTLTSSGGSCTIEGCSVSQANSLYDFGTNYCNIRMLYCGAADGCKPVKDDFTSPEGTVTKSIGAGKGIGNCLKVATVIV